MMIERVMANGKGSFGGLMMRLRRDTRGNTLAIVAASLIPLAGLMGGGIDMSRIYLTKTRLQQACDAGALTGRKAMGAGSWTTTANTGTEAQANRMFDANFANGAYGATNLSRNFTESGGKVTGTASAVLPMTVMKVFAQPDQTIQVSCDADMRIPNTDVMFVLDVTGSMSSTNRGDSAPKISGLKKAVKCFYEALAKVNTTADCGSTPSGSNSPTVQLRFGFVPYSSNVNVGRLLPNEYMADNWSYQTREAQFADQTTEGQVQLVSEQPSYSGNGTWLDPWQTYTVAKNSRSACDAKVPSANYEWAGSESAPQNIQTSSSGNAVTYTASTTQSGYYYTYEVKTYTSSSGRCVIRRLAKSATIVRNYKRVDTTTKVWSSWLYQQRSVNVSGLKAGGSTWNSSVQIDKLSKTEDAMTSVNWAGCIEERQTVRNTDGNPSDEFAPLPDDAYDLNIDMKPLPGNVRTQWGPSLPDLIWGRYTYDCYGRNCSYNNSYAPVTSSSELDRNYGYACPVESRKLQTYTGTAGVTNFENYVDSFAPVGNTYHDIGILWGARLMSPTGIFTSENAYTPSGGQIERHMVFMTDGDTNTSTTDYNAYGVPWWDRRQTRIDQAPTAALLDAQVDARLPALCSAVKSKNITLWVISFGTSVSDDTATRLKACASTGKFYSASDTAALISKFKQIADEIAQLRITR